MKVEVYAGQVDDTFGVGIEPLETLTTESVLNMLDYKSGRYSIEKPILLGAKLAGMSQEKLELLSKIGLKVGLVFQIVDDILGLFGKVEVTGKSNTSDIIEAKRTLLVTKTYAKATSHQQVRIKSILGNKDLTQEEADWFKNLVIETGVLAELTNFCKEEITTTKTLILQNFSPENQGTKFLIELCDYMVSREL